MEEPKSLLTEYEPIDTSTIKPINIYSERELENEAANICELLKDISNISFFINNYKIEGDWDKRLKALLTVQQCIVSENIRELNNFPSFMQKLVNPLT